MGIINQLIFFPLANIKTVILDWLFQLALVLKKKVITGYAVCLHHRCCGMFLK